MEHFAKDFDSVFQGAGSKPGLEIWCIDKLQLVPVSKSSHGKFYSGSAYLVLHTFLLKSGIPQHDIHYWLGSSANEVDSNLASDKALELDAFLGSHAVQYQEVQGQETEKFLSYFKPCIIPIEGVFSAAPADLGQNSYQISLLKCKGDRVVHIEEVPFARSSLSHSDVFILDTASKVFMFCGCNSSIQERAKALEVVQYIKENKHKGNCEIATIDDGKFVGDSDAGEFWTLFGGYAPIPRDLSSDIQRQSEDSAVKLFWITTQGRLHETGGHTPKRNLLESNKCYMLDCNTELFVWTGKNTSVTERKTSISAVEDFLRSQGRSTGTRLTFLTEGSETALFTSHFGDWPQLVEQKLYEEGREKVAAIFKQQGYDVKELPDDDEDFSSFMDFNGKIKVWGVNGDATTIISCSELMKLYSGDCYVVQYSYHSSELEENLFYTWIGQNSIIEDRADAISHMNALANSIKGDPVLALIVEGGEPSQFFMVFKSLIIFKGGTSARYKLSVSGQGIVDDTLDDTKVALFRVQGTSSYNMQAIQVDLVSSSLNSSYCYILKTEVSTFTWIGNLTSSRDHDLLDRMLDLINPTWQPVTVREGSEPDVFWDAFGGKKEYHREKEANRPIEDPRLFVCTSVEDDFKVKEIFNFMQDDLTTEDVLVLNCHNEIYIWIGRHSIVDSKQKALNIGQKLLGKDTSVGRLSLATPLYVVTEGCEPPFFTRYFEWDSSKANMLGNSFERKLAILKGNSKKLEAPIRSSWKAISMENGSNGMRSRSSSVDASRRSLSPASSVSTSNRQSSENRRFSSPASVTRKLFTEASPDYANSNGSDAAGNASILHDSEDDQEVSTLVYSYERVKVASTDPVADIDITRRESYLSNEEFQEVFGMSKKAFYNLPKWRQNKLKMSSSLF